MRLSRLQKNFESLASADPLWTVLSAKDKKGGKWDPEEFYQSGEDCIRGLQERLQGIGIPMTGHSALDFGCGVGRLTFPLSRRFDLAIGIDISASMLEAARQNAHRGRHCKFILNTEKHLDCLDSQSLDFAYSDIVFQHIAPRYSKPYFREIARALKPGGTFVFQLPSHLIHGSPLGKRLNYAAKALLQTFGLGPAYFEMNAIPRDALISFLERQAGLVHVADWDYPAAGPNWQSYLYAFQKL
ncbi:methyltransferase domain-containing protein [Pelagicoccus sp. SDUM812005]|uniref:class I SAM-dependent methyltransferase n=1 Tax=Pelagicoccus sp. SDUM812005 TaxID=3041257 RepID=UPI00280DF521|nr:methyltransferase domain-containing protein [Pelagicoccus sp. SDUM812005]MDQ8180890.1 methyltransferase domain-containing protein [Pelagicoccus sp. SDUM812005]